MMSKLFELNSEQSSLTDSLSQIIKEEIGDKYIPFSRFMNLALYHPEYGYYNNLLYKFGSQGDYVTSPLVSELFGVGLSRQIVEVFNRGVNPNILEFGAGNGQLMLDVLSNIGDTVDHYYILELSHSLVRLQQERLASELPSYQDKVIWLSSLPDGFNGVVIGNEILDAIVCDVVCWKNKEIYSKVVTYHDNQFVFADVKANEQLTEAVKTILVPSDGYISEISLERIGFIKTLNDVLNKGVILLIDYGTGRAEHYSANNSHGTLRAFFRQHLLDDVLIYPGLMDITSSVDFTAIATAGLDSGLELIGFTTQANFLINCGILNELAKRESGSTDAEYLQLTNQLNRLISPNEMGEVFKVIGFSKNLQETDYIGFASGDRTYTL